MFPRVRIQPNVRQGFCVKPSYWIRGQSCAALGFTLVELMFVVGIIAIIAAIAVPNLLRSRIQANEASAIGDLRTIAAAQISYNTAKQAYGSFDDLTADPAAAGIAFLERDWKEGRQKSGYIFTMPVASSITFTCLAAPIGQGTSGVRYFRIDPSGLVRYNYSGAPAATDPIIGQL